MVCELYKIKGHLKSHKNQLLPILVILVLGLLSITWFKGDNIITVGDTDLNLKPMDNFHLSYSVWWDKISTGQGSLASIASIISLSGLVGLL